MNILILNRSRSINGTATMLFHFAQQLKQDGHQVYYLKFPEKYIYIEKEILNHAQLIQWHTLLNQKKLPDIEVIFAPTFEMLAIALWLQQHCFLKARILAGIYHPRQYLFNKNQVAMKRITAKIFKYFPDENIIFMNNQTRLSHQITLQRDFFHSNIIPVPVALDNITFLHKPEKTKLVSIGRLVDFKIYPFGVIDALVQLNKQGIYLTYHIYGDGPLYTTLQNYIYEKGLSNQVFLHGAVLYKDFFKVLENAYGFIGCGISIVEACSMGVPSLIAVDSLKQTYGLFSATEGYEIGEFDEGKKLLSFDTCIKELVLMSEQEYVALQRAAMRRAQDFALPAVMEKFYQAIKDSRLLDKKIVSLFDLVGLLINKLVNRLLFFKGINK